MKEIEKIVTSASFIIAGLMAYIGSAIFWAIINTSGRTFRDTMGITYGLMGAMGIIGLMLIIIGVLVGIITYLSVKKKNTSDNR